MADDKAPFEGWAVLELMGHRRLGGYVAEATVAGAGFLRIDVPGEGDEPVASQFYSPSSVYCLTPTTEAMARAVAAHNVPQPVARWELPAKIEPKTCSVCDERPCIEGCPGEVDADIADDDLWGES
ncbi:MAG TPA: hypothetical protein VFJ85_02960 [Acidimicrobiales bacterium]|nr:hypothetical protein [Acidimicrobiales bacterium]